MTRNREKKHMALDLNRQWLAAKQNLGRVSPNDQRGEEEQEQEERKKTCLDSDEVYSFSFFFLHISAICCILDSVSTVRNRHRRRAQTYYVTHTTL